MRSDRWVFWLGLLYLGSGLLPWVTVSGAGFNLNPVDLAEWTSLAPAIQNQSPPLFTTFLLRTFLLIATLLLALGAGRRRWLAVIVVIVLAAAQFPPFEFLADSGNANYRQQMLMAALTLALGFAAVFLLPVRYRELVAVIVTIVGLVAIGVGVSSALATLGTYGLDAAPGLGAWIAAIALASALVVSASGIKKRRTQAPLSDSVQHERS